MLDVSRFIYYISIIIILNMAEKKRIGLLDSLNTDFVSSYIHKGAEKGQALSVSAI